MMNFNTISGYMAMMFQKQPEEEEKGKE